MAGTTNNVVLKFVGMLALLMSTECARDTTNCYPCLKKNIDEVINIVVLMRNRTAIKALPAIYRALKDLQEFDLMRGPLENYTLSINYSDSKSSSIEAPLQAMDFYYKGMVDLFIGPVDDYALAPVCRYSKEWGTTVLSPAGKPVTFNGDPKLDTLIRLNGYYTQLGELMLTLCKYWNWDTLAILYEEESENKGPSACHHMMSEVYRITKEDNNFIVNYEKFAEHKLETELRTLSQKARIILFCALNETSVYETMMTANELGLTHSGEYVFFNFDLDAGPADAYHPWGNELTPEEEQAFSAMFTVTSHTLDTPDYRDFSKRIKDMGGNIKNLQDLSISKELQDLIMRESKSSGLVPPYIASVYEGVMLYAEVFNKTLTTQQNHKNITKFKLSQDILKTIASNYTFFSRVRKQNVTLRNTTIPEDYSIFNFDPSSKTFKEVAVYLSHNKEGNLSFNGRAIHWPGKRTGPPIDEPECGFQGEKCPGSDWMIVVLSMLVLILSVCIIIAVRKYRLEAQITSMYWKIPYSDIVFEPVNEASVKGRFGSLESIGRISQHSQHTMNSIETLLSRQIFIKTGIYKGNRVAVKHLCINKVNLTRPLLLELRTMKELTCDYLVRMIGACFEGTNNCIIIEYCPRGSLQDVLENEERNLDDMMKYSLLHDAIKGLTHLHSSQIRRHGNLKSTNCVVDSRLVLKLTDFGILSLRCADVECCLSVECHQMYEKKLWTAPELLRTVFGALSYDSIQRADIYSLGIIINEIFCRLGPFPLHNQDQDDMLSPMDIVERVKGGVDPVLRPFVADDTVDHTLKEMMHRCWAEDPALRPSLASIKAFVRKRNKDNESGNILDNLLDRLVLYTDNLETLVAERTQDYLDEKHKCEQVLYQLLPQSVARQLIEGKPVMAKTYDSVTIYFSDIVGFTGLSAQSSPMQVVDMLNSLYSLFDTTISEFDVYKVETIGDAYMVVSGLPVMNNNDHAREVAGMALNLLRAVRTFKIPHRPDKLLLIRIGVHSGPCVAGVVGTKMPRYCLFGDTVNTASRMESNGLPMKIHVSGSTQAILSDHFPSFQLELRGDVEMKGKGMVTTYWLREESPCEEDPLLQRRDTNDTIESERFPTQTISARSSLSSPSVDGRGDTSILMEDASSKGDVIDSIKQVKCPESPFMGTGRGKVTVPVLKKVTFNSDEDESSMPLLINEDAIELSSSTFT